MHWLLLAIGIGIEIMATASLKLSDGFTKFGFAGVTLICFGLAFYGKRCLTPTLRVLG